MNQEKWDEFHEKLDEALDSEFGKAKVALRKYLLENKEKVANDLEEMREKSNEDKMKKTAVQWLAIEWNRIENKWKNVGQGENHCVAEKKEVLGQAESMERDQMILLVERLMEYTRESRSVLGNDEREASEFVDIFYGETFK